VVNHVGWLVAAVLLVAALHLVIAAPATAALPISLWLWTFASSVLANAAFFGRPAVAVAGGVGMGLVAVPLVLRLRAGQA
jgi:putative membrane protein